MIHLIPQMLLADATWAHMFTLDDTVSWGEKIVRPMLVYVVLVTLLRLFGKRELGQLNPFDLVVILSLSNTVQNAMIGEDNSLIGGVVGASALLATNYFMSVMKFHYRPVERLVEGTSRTIIENSKVHRAAVRKELLTEEDLDTIAHREGLAGASEIERCVIDPNGSFLVEGNTRRSDENFRREVLARLEDLHRQLAELKGNP